MAELDNGTDEKFSRDYVEKLRKENAEWRTKFRDLEVQVTRGSIESELNKRNIKADPAWVKLDAGMDVVAAVDMFVEQYPHLSVGDNITPAPKKTVPAAQGAGKPNTNVPSNPAQGRSLDEVKKDPVARSALRDKYRELIRQSSRQTETL